MSSIPYITDQLLPLAIRVEEIQLDPENARRHPDKNMKGIRSSLKKFGQRKPIVVQKTANGLVCRAGNGTLIQTKSLKREWIAAVVIEESNEMAKAFAIADNRSGELSEWDDYVLTDTLRELSDNGFDVDTIGFSDKEFEKLLNSVSGHVEDNLESKKSIVKDNVEYLIVISCEGEDEQAALYEELLERGVNCKIM